MVSLKKFVWAWLPAIFFMAIIFYLSSRPRTSITAEFTIDFLIFKSLHIIEYAILYFLVFRAFYLVGSKKRFFWPALITLLYAASDEWHQTFVPTREGRLRDVIIDAAGMYIMYMYIKHYLMKIPKILL